MGVLLHHSIDESAERDPNRQAFRFDGQGITYAELVTRANRLANLLVSEGVRPSDRVGVYMNKGLELPVAVYGALKAGGAYVPIDPAAPPARVQFIVQNCGIRHLLTNASRAQRAVQLAARTPEVECTIGTDTASSTGTRCFSWLDVDTAPTRSPDVRQGEDDLAYVMYTSGSTGVPKGLMHTHASGRSYAVLSAREYDVRPDDRLGNHSPLHFDMSTFEYLTGPLCGATTVIISEEATMFPRSLAELIERERLTFWYSVPLALIQLLERGGIEERDVSSLRWVLFGGEPFPPKHLAHLAELLPGARFSNSYGPAEVNQCTAFHVPQAPINVDEPIPIGRPWAGADAMIVDDGSRPVSPGQAGELLVHAPTMMRGYWSRPDLDQRSFFYESDGDQEKRFYRTGDLVREQADGNLVFLGRKDRQIKVRGYRVELEEVEAVMNSLAGVAEAAAVDIRDSDGQTTIVAAVLAHDASTLDPDTLRRGAAEKLSAYAVPARIEIEGSLPRTGSGKIDRSALREKLARPA